MDTEHFSEYTKLMLARMEDTPEEFTGDHYGGRWAAFEGAMVSILNGERAMYFSAFPAEEVGALIVKYKKIVQHQMFKQAIRTILEGEKISTQEHKYIIKNSNTIIKPNTIANQGTLTLNHLFNQSYNNLFNETYNNLTPTDVQGSGETISYGLASQALKKGII